MAYGCWFASLGLFLFNSALFGQEIRLSGELAPALAEVGNSETRFSRSGASVVFLVRQGGTDELHAAPRDGTSAPVRLHPSLVGTSQRVSDFAPCSAERVVFRADLDVPGRQELYLAPLDGSAAPVLLSGTPRATVTQYALTPDGAQVVFLSERGAGVAEPFVVTIDGGLGPIPLDPAGNGWSDFQLTPDGSQLFLVRPTAFTQGLFRVPLDASQPPSPVATSDSFQPPCSLYAGRFGPLALSADGQHAAYIEVTECGPPVFCNAQFTRVFGVEQATGAVTLLDQAECALQTVLISGPRVLILRQDGLLRSVKTDGTGSVTLASAVLDLTLTPDGSQVVLLRNNGVDRTLAVAQVDGATPLRELTTGVIEAPLQVTADSNLVVYVQTLASGFRALRAVSVDAVGPLLLNGPEVPGRGVRTFRLAPAGAALVYLEERAQDDVYELVGLDLDLIPRRLALPTPGMSTLEQPVLAPDGSWVTFLESVSPSRRGPLFGVPLDASALPVEYVVPPLSGSSAGDVVDFRVSGNGRQVVYRADELRDQSFQLFVRQAEALTPGRKLSESLPERGTVEAGYVLAPDGEHVAFVYRSGLDLALYTSEFAAGAPLALEQGAQSYGLLTFASAAGRLLYRRDSLELRSVRLDGTQAPLDLLGTSFGPITSLALALDGVNALVLAGGRLLRVPVDGSAAPAELGPTLIPSGAVSTFAVTGDGAEVVLLADAELDGRFELYAQPLDGSLPAVKLSGALVAGGSVLDFALAGARIVYRADQTLDDVPELYSVPLTGGTPLRLTVLSAGARVEPDYRVGASGLAVFYRLFQTRSSLYRVPLDGSSAPLRLHAAPRAGSIGVSAFEASADGQRIALLADLRVPQFVELFSVPESGGALTTLAQVSSGQRLVSFRLSPGNEAYFLREDAQHRPIGLFRVPLDGRRAPSLVHAPVALGLGAENDYVPLRSGVVFRGDLEADGRFELFRSDPRGPATTGNAARPTVTRTILR